MIDYYAPQLDLTLLGCGFLGTYHLGAICLLSQVWPRKPYNRICGASCGGLLGALLIAGIKLDLVLASAMDILKQLRRALRKPSRAAAAAAGPTIGELVERTLERLLPADAHTRCSGRLGVSLTKVGGRWWPPLENRFLSEFATRRQLIDAIRAGCFIPIWSGALIGPKLEGSHFIDGAYSDNSPKFERELPARGNNGKHSGHDDADDDDLLVSPLAETPPQSGHLQVELSPFAGQVEVSPAGERGLFSARVLGSVYLANWNNVTRFWHAMLPAHATNYRPYLLGGHRDMKEFLFRRQLIKCRACFETSAGRKLEEPKTASATACLACLKLLERVDSLRVPDHLLSLLDE